MFYMCNSTQPKDTWSCNVCDLYHTSSSRLYPCWVTFKIWKVINKSADLFLTLEFFWLFSIVWVLVCCKLTATNFFTCEKLKLDFFLIDYIWNLGRPVWTQGKIFCHGEGDQALAQVKLWRLHPYGPGELAVGCPASAPGLGQVISRGSFPPQPCCDSMKL